MDIPFLEQGKKSKQKESDWFHLCSLRNIPMVITETRSAFGDVSWDYITMEPSSEDFFYTQKKFIVSEIKKLLNYYVIPRTIESIGSTTGYVKNLPLEHVSDFALDVCNTLMEAHKRHQRDEA